MKKILVTGASGQMGTVVIDTLLKKMPASHIHVITRKEEKRLDLQTKGLTAFIGDYGDVASLEKAIEGVDTVLLISSGDQGDRMQEHKNVINTAKKMGVANIAYTSRSLRD
jgi:NAD(P)H dehydrogenase (quinone)